MGRSISTSISDGVLAFVSLHAAFRILGSSVYGATGFLIVGVAACFGTARFAYTQPSRSLTGWHDYMAWLARVVGLSCLAAGFYRQEGVATMANIHLAASVALVLLQKQLSEKAQRIATEIVSTLAVVSTLLCSILHFNAYALVGSMLYVISGTVVKTEGDMSGIPRVDIFHYMLAVANIALMMALDKQVQPIYYTPSASA